MDTQSIETPFTKIPTSRWITHNSCFFVMYDNYPVSPGHMLIISKRVVPTFFELTPKEQRKLLSLISQMKEKYEVERPGSGRKVDGWNIGMNCGAMAGQTVAHFHCHLIPRYRGDMENPAGGIRHCVAGKGYYKTEEDAGTKD